MKLQINTTWGDYVVPIIMHLKARKRDILSGSMEFKFAGDLIAEIKFQYPIAFFRHDFIDFVAQATECLDRLDGTAKLKDTNGTTVLCLRFVDSARGRVLIGGQLHALGLLTDPYHNDLINNSPLATPAKIEFGEFVTDQSYVKNFLADLNRFLSQTEESTKH